MIVKRASSPKANGREANEQEVSEANVVVYLLRAIWAIDRNKALDDGGDDDDVY